MSRDSPESVRGSGRPVIELECGITVYPPQQDGDPWRAVFMENGQRRYREAVTEEKLAAKLEKVTERLQADAPNMERPGTDLIAYYLSPGRHPATRPWSRKHADTQRRLCERFVGSDPRTHPPSHSLHVGIIQHGHRLGFPGKTRTR